MLVQLLLAFSQFLLLGGDFCAARIDLLLALGEGVALLVEGVLLFVSHDRYFIEKFATRIWLLQEGTIRDFPCGYAKYRSILEHEAMQRVPQPRQREKKPKPVGGARELEKQVRRLEREIDAQEQKLQALDGALAAASSDYQELVRLTAEREAEEKRLDEMMERWEALASELES